MTLLGLIIGGLVGVATAAGAYFAVRLAKSGRVSTTEAGVLWEESSKIRQALRDDVVDLRAQVRERDARIDVLEDEARERDRAMFALERRIAVLESTANGGPSK